MSSATEELHRLLDERGVEYRFNDVTKVFEWHFDGTGGGGYAHATEVNGGVNIIACSLTPEQAIEATLGREDTYTREDVEGAFVSGYSLGLDMFDSSKQEKGWNQNERNLDEEMEDLGWVRKDTAKLDTGTCRNAAPSYLDFLCSECGFVYYRNDENFCGDNDWNFCPNCGRKVVKE